MEPFLDFLFKKNLLTEQQVKACQFLQKTQNKSVLEVLTQRKFLTIEQVSHWQEQFELVNTVSERETNSANDLLDDLNLFAQQNKKNKPPQAEHTTLKLEALSEKDTWSDHSPQKDDLFASLEVFAQEKKQLQNPLTPSGTTKAQAIVDAPENEHFQAPPEIPTENRYDLLETLGQGGMGIVQRVKDKILRREVALKRIKSPQKEKLSKMQKVMLWRLRREAEITAILEHPNIVPLYDMQKQGNGELYFTMRKVKGETLQSILKKMRSRKIPFEEQQLLSIFLKVCDAIAYAHAEKIVHRDLKPDNIMVGAFGEVYVMDWGIAKVLGEQDAAEMLESEISTEMVQQGEYKTVGGMGTPGYMPPEQQENASEVKPQSDIYALGKMLRQCFTLISPMEEFHLKVEVDRKKKDASATLQEIEEKVPEEIQAIVKKATEDKIEQRYFSVQVFSNDIQQYLAHERVSAKTYRFSEIVLKWIQRNKQKVLFGSIILALCIFFPLYSQWNQYQKRQKGFTEASLLAQQSIKKAAKYTQDNRESHQEKIGELLNALHFLNDALSLFPKDEALEKHKKEVGDTLIALCIESQDYQLADYVAKDLKSLHILEEDEKERRIQHVKNERKRLLEQHQEQFRYWKERYQNGEQDKGDREELLFEISKMTEQEISLQLLEILKEGTNYFIERTQQNPKKSEFYEIFATALGRMGNAQVGEELMLAIKTLLEKKTLLYTEERDIPIDENNYLVTLAEALGNIRALNQAKELEEIRNHLLRKNFNFFSNQTQKVSKLLALGNLSANDEAVQKNPKEASAYYKRGITQFNQDAFEKAIEDFTQAIQRHSTHFDAYLMRGLARGKINDFSGAIEDCNQAIRIFPQREISYNNRGYIKYLKNDFIGAIEDYNQAIQLNPNYSQTYFNRGIARGEIKDFSGAIEDYNQTIQLNPSDFKSYTFRGLTKYKQKNFEEAIQDLDQAIQLNLKNIDAYRYRGDVKFAKKDFDGAIEDYDIVIQFDPKNAIGYNHRGTAKYEKGDLDGAIADSTTAISLQPQYAEAYNYRGLAKFDKKDFDGAIADYSQSIQINLSSALAYYYRANAKFRKNDFLGAIEDQTKSIELDPQYAKAYNNRGYAKYIQGDFEGTILDCNKAISLQPELAEAYSNRALAKTSKKDFEGAIADFSEVIRLNPQEVMAYQNRGIVKYKKQDREGAKADFQQFFSLTQNTKNSDILKKRQAILEVFPELSK